MYGYQLLSIYERMRALGLTTSRQDFALRWCGRGEDYLRDYARRDGAGARVSTRTIARVRARLAEAASLLPAGLATEVHAIDASIERDLRVADLLGRRSASAVLDP